MTTLSKMLDWRDREGLTDLLAAAELDPERTLCPFCGCGFLVPGTIAADLYGVCLACYERAKASANREYYRVIAAHKDGERTRQEAHRLKKKLGADVKRPGGANEMERCFNR